MVKRSLIILLMTLVVLSVACKSSEKDVQYSAVEFILKPNVISNTLSSWVPDSTKSFEYLEVTPTGENIPYINSGFEAFDDIFIYETYDESGTYKLYGFMDKDFRTISNPISLKPNMFKNGLARVDAETESYIIDTNMNRKIVYYPGFVIHDGTLFEIAWEDYHGLELNEDGQFKRTPLIVHEKDLDNYLVPYIVDQVETEDQVLNIVGYARLQDVYGADQNTEVECVIQPFYEEARLFHEGIAAVKQKSKWGYINEAGEAITECIYDEVNDFVNGFAAVYIREIPSEITGNVPDLIDAWAIINSDGELTSPFMFGGVSDFINGVGLAYPKWTRSPVMFIDTKGELTGVGNISHTISTLSEGLRLIPNSGYWYYDSSGNLAINKIFGLCRNFSDGLAAAKGSKSTRWGYINKTGEYVFKPAFLIAGDFSRGYALVVEAGNSSWQAGLMDKTGKKYLEDLNLAGITRFNENGYAIAYSSRKTDNGNKNIYYMIRINSDN